MTMDWLKDYHIWKDFEAYLTARRLKAYQNMAYAKDTQQIYQYQGEIRMLDELLKMREKAKNG